MDKAPFNLHAKFRLFRVQVCNNVQIMQSDPNKS